MSIEYFEDVVQGSDEWYAMRNGLLTASEMKLIVSPTLKLSSNDKERSHVLEIAAQRINNYTEPTYFGYDMMRGQADEVSAKIKYSENYDEVKDVGFITNDRWGFTLGYSPDGLVGEEGQIECKSRKQKLQLETMLSGEVHEDHMLQVQAGLLISERKWCDYITYCGGMHMMTIRVFPDLRVHEAIIRAATAFEKNVEEKITAYNKLLKSDARLIPTERTVEEDISVDE